MPRVKRSVHARKKRRKVLEQAKGYWGLKQLELPVREGAGRALARLRLPRPQEQEADVPRGSGSSGSTPPRARTGSRTTSSSPAAARPRSSSTARCSPTSPSTIRPRSRKIAEQAKAALAGRTTSAELGEASAAGGALRARRLAAVRASSPRARGRPARRRDRRGHGCAGTCRCASSAALHYLELSGGAPSTRGSTTCRGALLESRAGLAATASSPSSRSRRTRSQRSWALLPAFLRAARTGGRSTSSSSGRAAA